MSLAVVMVVGWVVLWDLSPRAMVLNLTNPLPL